MKIFLLSLLISVALSPQVCFAQTEVSKAEESSDFYDLIAAPNTAAVHLDQQGIDGGADTTIHSVELETYVIKGAAPTRISNHVRPQNAYITFNPTTADNKQTFFDSCYFLTKFNAVASNPVSLYSLDIRLKPFDTSLFDVNLMVLQINNGDTVYKSVTVDAGNILNKKWHTLMLKNEHIIIQPNDFYVGYGFHRKNIPKRYMYRLLASEKGEGAMAVFIKGQLVLSNSSETSDVFPFKISYRKL